MKELCIFAVTNRHHKLETMKKLFLSLCLVMLGFGSILAGPVDQQKAQKIGTKFLSTTALSQKNADIQLQLVSASTLDKEIKGSVSVGSNIEAAKAVGKLVGERAIAKDIKDVVFDRGGYLYHGRVQALAEAAREAGLSF